MPAGGVVVDGYTAPSDEEGWTDEAVPPPPGPDTERLIPAAPPPNSDPENAGEPEEAGEIFISPIPSRPDTWGLMIS